MKALIQLFTMILMASTCLSQSIDKNTFASSGESYSTNTHRLDFTIGEAVIQTYTSANNIITSGFHQPILTVEVINGISNLQIDVSIYPNPTSSFINLNLGDNESLDGFIIGLFDFQGRQLQRLELNNTNSHKINLAQYREGIYILTISKNDRVTSYKINKI